MSLASQTNILLCFHCSFTIRKLARYFTPSHSSYCSQSEWFPCYLCFTRDYHPFPRHVNPPLPCYHAQSIPCTAQYTEITTNASQELDQYTPATTTTYFAPSFPRTHCGTSAAHGRLTKEFCSRREFIETTRKRYV